MDWSNSTNSLLLAMTYGMFGEILLQPGWPCGQKIGAGGAGIEPLNCDLAKLAKSNSTYWAPFPSDFFIPQNETINGEVRYCLAQQVTRTCDIGLTPVIVWIALAANTLKVICFSSTLFYIGRESKPLVTTGDMIESFISKPDLQLTSRCLASISHVSSHPEFWTAQQLPLQWLPRRRRWVRGASLSAWLSLFVPAILGIVAIINLYVRNQLSGFLTLDFTSANTSELVWWDVPWNLNHGLIGSVLLANAPQTILSYIYTAYNALLTAMLSQAELLRYGTICRGLRVTSPTGEQRSTYWLQLPYRFSLPPMAASVLLHWLVAESFFLVRVNVYRPDGTQDPSQLISTVGYSSLAVLVSLIIMSLMLLGILALGLVMRYPATMPLAANCSASLAAISQPLRGGEFESDLALKKLSWGVIDQDVDFSGVEDRVQEKHATFSAGMVNPLVERDTYE